MKPSLEEVWAMIERIYIVKGKKVSSIPIDYLAEEMYEHYDNILPSLLFFEQEDKISLDESKQFITILNAKKNIV